MPFATLFTGNIAECYGDQDRYSDPHAYADPDDLFVYATVALSWKTRFISHFYMHLEHLNIKCQIPFLMSEEIFR